MTYIGKKKNHGAWYVMSEVAGVRHEREFPGLSDAEFYDVLRKECGLTGPDKQIYRDVVEKFTWNGTAFVRSATQS